MNFNNIDINSQLNSIFKKKKYTVGFLFSLNGESVCLIKKTKPDWQKGFLNGVGGKVEEGESYINCIIREFKEEAGVEILNWIEAGKMVSNEWEVMVYFAFDDSINNVASLTEEEVDIYNVKELSKEKVLPNVPILIGLCLNREVKSFAIQY